MRQHLLLACLLVVSCAKASSPTMTADQSNKAMEESPGDAAKPTEMPKTESEVKAKESKSDNKPAAAAASPGGMPLLDPKIGAAGVALGKAEIKGSLSAADIASTIERSMAGLEFCYDEARQSNPTLSGKMKLSFTIGADGSASSVDAKEGVSSDLDQCIEKKVAQLKFPSGLEKTEVTYPLVFTVK